MGRAIIKIKEYYLIWSTVVDAPITFGMNREQLEKWIKEEYGRSGTDGWMRLIPDADEKGTSFIEHENVKRTISCNHAGPEGKRLTLEEIYRAYCLLEPIRNGWKAYKEET